MKTNVGYGETMILSDLPVQSRQGKMIRIEVAPGVWQQWHEEVVVRLGLIPAPPKQAEPPPNKMRKQAPNKGG